MFKFINKNNHMSQQETPIQNIDNKKERKSINKKLEKHVWKVVVAIIVICIIASIYDLKTDENYYINLDNPNLIQTQDGGYKEELICYSTVNNKKIKMGGIIGGKNFFRREYIISCYNDELNEYLNIKTGDIKYNELEIGDSIKVTRTVYYNKSGLRLYYDDHVEKINK